MFLSGPPSGPGRRLSGGGPRVRIPFPPPASQQRTVPCSGSPLILMKGSAGIDGLSGSAKGKGLMVRSPFLQRGVSYELFGGCGPGEWLAEKHAARAPRSWRKLHIGVDADTGQIIAAELTSKDVDDGSQVGPLLEQIAGPVASFTGDGAYDRDDVYREVCQRHPDAAVIVPPRSSAVPSATAETAPTKRDRHLQLIAERGRMGWQRATGYNWRALVEADHGRHKRVIGDALRSRTEGRQTTEVAIAAASLNRMLELGRPEYVRLTLMSLRGPDCARLLIRATKRCRDLT